MILAIDPGKRHAGCALFEDGELASAWLSKADKKKAESLGSWHAATALAVNEQAVHRTYPDSIDAYVIERPEIYKGQSVKLSNDCVDLAIVGGALAGLGALQLTKVHFCLPKEWKGQVEKQAMVRRIEKRLRDGEYGRVDLPKNKARQTDVWDAIGIGLRYVGRL